MNSHTDGISFRNRKWSNHHNGFGDENHQEFVFCNTKMGPRWMDPIVEFLSHNKLVEDKREAHKLLMKTTHFWISQQKTCTRNLTLSHISLVRPPNLNKR